MKKIKELSKYILIIVALCLVFGCSRILSQGVEVNQFVEQIPQANLLNITYDQSRPLKWSAEACFMPVNICVYSEGNNEQDLLTNLKLKAQAVTGEEKK